MLGLSGDELFKNMTVILGELYHVTDKPRKIVIVVLKMNVNAVYTIKRFG